MNVDVNIPDKHGFQAWHRIGSLTKLTPPNANILSEELRLTIEKTVEICKIIQVLIIIKNNLNCTNNQGLLLNESQLV